LLLLDVGLKPVKPLQIPMPERPRRNAPIRYHEASVASKDGAANASSGGKRNTRPFKRRK
jgi:hypothetical protein